MKRLHSSRSCLAMFVLTAISFSLSLAGDPAAAQRREKKEKSESAGPAPVAGALDGGQLDQSWFGGPRVWRETEEADYFWVDETFDFSGKSLHFVAWPEPKELMEGRDENDYRMARQMANEIPKSFADTFNRNFTNLPSSAERGDLRVEGRVVDCSTGSTAAKVLVGFGAGAGNTTIDVKFVDTKSGRVVAGLHHRVVSGTSWSTTDSKFFKWLKKFGEELSEKGWHKTYRAGDRRSE